MSKITAVVNNKGGVGKTHTVFHLAGAYAELGQHVLVIDLDPQGNLTSLLQRGQPRYTLYDVLVEDVSIHDAIQTTDFDRIEFIPSHGRLEAIDALLSHEPDAQIRLADSLKELFETRTPDQILLDCPPSLALTTRNALAAADQAIIPVEADKFSVEGILKLNQAITSVKKVLNPKLQVAGILVSLFTGRRNIESMYEQKLRSQELPVFSTRIKDSVKYREAITNRKPITQYRPVGEHAEAFRQLIGELEHAYVS